MRSFASGARPVIAAQPVEPSLRDIINDRVARLEMLGEAVAAAKLAELAAPIRAGGDDDLQ
jgi:hypothetical protein